MRENERKRTRKRRISPKERSLKERIAYLRVLGLTAGEIYEHLVVNELLLNEQDYEAARKAKELLRLDAWHTTVEFGYWI